MFKKALKYGGGAGVALGVIFLVTNAALSGQEPNYRLGEVVGYLSMTLSLLVVYFGIRSYRNDELDGAITYGQALKMGLLISLFVAAPFAAIDALYVTVINPDFFSDYMSWKMDGMRAGGATQAEVDAYEAQFASFQGPSGVLLNAGVMFLTVFLIGFIVSAISALVLRSERATA